MKKIIRIIVMMTCLIVLTACSSQLDSDQNSTTTNTLDLGVLTDINAFEGMGFYNGDKVYQAQIDDSSKGLYFRLFLKGSSNPEAAISFYSTMVGDTAPESIAQNIDYFNNGGGVQISGTIGDSGLSADVYIDKTDTGYEVRIETDVSSKYKQYLDKMAQNFNNGVIWFDPEKTGVDILYFEFDSQSALLEVNLEDNTIICMRTYQLDSDSFKIYQDHFTSDGFIDFMGQNTDNDPDIMVDGSITNIQCQRGEIFIGINLNSDDYSITLSQLVYAIDKNISEY